VSSLRDLIQEATGETDPKQQDELADIMRRDIFHSTLDWQTRDELMAAAKEAVVVFDYLVAEGLA